MPTEAAPQQRPRVAEAPDAVTDLAPSAQEEAAGPEAALWAALFQFQTKVEVVYRETTGQEGNREFKYADLPTIMAKIKPLLTELQLLVHQTIGIGSGGSMYLTTTIRHVRGATTSNDILIPPCDNPKTLGKWITYLRRYGLTILGIVTDKDPDEAPVQGRRREVAGGGQPAGRPSRPTPVDDTRSPNQRRYFALLDAACKAKLYDATVMRGAGEVERKVRHGVISGHMGLQEYPAQMRDDHWKLACAGLEAEMRAKGIAITRGPNEPPPPTAPSGPVPEEILA